MNYTSTRGKIEPIEVAYAAAGIYAPDGGLYAPEEMPRKFDDEDHDMLCLAWLSHKRRFAFLTGKFMKEIYIALPALFGDSSFAAEDFAGDIPSVHLRKGKCFLEMWHGPSGSSLELELRPLPMLYEYKITAVAKGNPYIYGYNIEPNGERAPLILVPSAGEEALALIEATKKMTKGKIAVFYPVNETSEVNSRLLEENQSSRVIVRGVKAGINEISHHLSLFLKGAEAAALAEKSGLYPMRGDSQNWFGLISHVAHFASAYCGMIVKEHIKLGDWINLAIPYDETMELAAMAFCAKDMGLKVDKIICPAPADSILYKLVTKGELDADCFKDGMFIPPVLERLLHAVSDMDKDFICSVIEKLEKDGYYKLPNDLAKKLQDAFYFYRPTADEIKSAIKEHMQFESYPMTQSTAATALALDKYKQEYADEKSSLVVAGENPYKESVEILAILGNSTVRPWSEAVKELAAISSIPAPEFILNLNDAGNSKIVDLNDMAGEIAGFMK